MPPAFEHVRDETKVLRSSHCATPNLRFVCWSSISHTIPSFLTLLGSAPKKGSVKLRSPRGAQAAPRIDSEPENNIAGQSYAGNGCQSDGISRNGKDKTHEYQIQVGCLCRS